jgi:DNA modification methylase
LIQKSLCELIGIEKPHHDKDLVTPGDIWQLGRHRLMCGDSTKLEDVTKLLDGRRANLTLTDPPYANGESYETYNDTVDELKKLIDNFLPLAFKYSDVVLVTPGNENHYYYPKPSWTLCWFIDAGVGSTKWGFSCWQPILAYGKDPYLKNNMGRRPDAFAITQSSDNSLGHPCPKPINVWSWILKRGSAHEGDLIYDPFSGSGTSFIVSEKLKRTCYGMEINPNYCNIIIKRYEERTGDNAKLISRGMPELQTYYNKEKVLVE